MPEGIRKALGDRTYWVGGEGEILSIIKGTRSTFLTHLISVLPETFTRTT